ncbi:phosphotransferase [Candidatus Bathyarchaeota archaeon]|nr:phosphotransferase [Candidatus Bathyarchaeota archaeon]
MVSLLFFWGDHFDYDVPKGPFRSSYDWVSAHLGIMKLDHIAALEKAEDEEDRQDAENAQRIAERLSALAPKIFPSIQGTPERTILWHSDLSLQNILVNEQGEITAIIDWERVSTMPHWAACELPKFLDGTAREDEPQRYEYGDESESGSDKGQDNEDDELDNEGKNGLYWIDLMEYEQTQLRKAYAARMQQLHPAWDVEVEESLLKQDIMWAINLCGESMCLKKIEEWVDHVEKGDFRRLGDVINPPLL